MNQKHQEDLSHIRSMMERSSRFISLSGLSGVFAGLSALIGGLYAYQLLGVNSISYMDGHSYDENWNLVREFFFTSGIVLFFGFGFWYFLYN